MAEEKEQPKLEDTASDHTTTKEIGDAIDEKRLLRKLDWHLIPGPTLLLLLSFMDRSNVGNARIEGLVADLHMTGEQFLTALTIYIVGFVLFEVPCNIMLKLTTPRFWLPTLAFIWGTITTLTGVTQNFSGFISTRFFLGLVESGFIPGCIFYMSMWYKRNEQNYRIALLLSTATLAGAFGGIFAFGIAKMRGIAGLGGWRWIFIIEGLLTVAAGLGAYFFIHNYPATARFLTPKEREYVIGRLKDDCDAVRDESFTWDGVFQALKDPKVWLYGLCFHTVGVPISSLGSFLPTIINELGYTPAQTQLLSIPPYVGSFILTMAVAVFAEKTKLRAPFIIASSSLAIAGFVILIASHRPEVSYGGTILAVSGAYCSAAIVAGWPANNVSGQTKRAVASAVQISVGNLGGIVGSQLYRPKWAPRFLIGNCVALGYLVGNLFLVSLLWYVLKNENARRDRGERDDRLRDVDEGVFLGDDDPRWRFQT